MTEIACPTCQKKYRLGERFPAVFSCKACGTAMDLSSFPGAQKAPLGPAVPAPGPSDAAAAAGAAASGRSRPGRAGAARARGSARAAARGKRGRGGDEAGEDDAGFVPARRGVSPALLWGSIGGMVCVVVLLVLVLASKKNDEPPQKTAGTGTPAATPADPAAPAPADPTAPAAATPAGAAPAAGTPGAAAPAATPGAEGAPAAAPAEEKKWTTPGKTEIAAKGHHPDATPEEQAKIDALIEKAVFENAGRDSLDAEKELVAMGAKAAPKIVNVFHRVKTGEGYETRTGMMKIQIADRMLRRIDGLIERKISTKLTPVHVSSTPKHAERIMRAWNWWVDTEGWKRPEKPWDERVDGRREDAEEAPGSEAAMGGGG